MIALLKLKEYGGFGWQGLLEEYVLILKNDPERYREMLESHRGEGRSGKNP
jgi:hypothetical protein